MGTQTLPTGLRPALIHPEHITALRVWRGTQEYPLAIDQRRFTVGSADCDIVIESPYVSSLQATIERRGDLLRIVSDPSAKNPITFQDRPVKVIEIGPGERIGVGDVSLLTLSHAMQMERRSFELILGTGADARTLVDLTLLAANRNGHLLLWGERGTGHELLARAVHAVSTRRAHSLLTIEEPIAEGAERAVLDSGRRGMVLVDLMATADGRLHRELVSRLLRPEQNARVVVAAESYEHAMASLGTALVAQLHPIHLPALRTRTAEIPELLDRLFRLEGVATVGDLGESNLAGLAAYPWQGDMCANLDELIYASRYLAMRASGLSQTKAAQAVGWSQPTASRREREWGVTFKSDGDGRGDRRRS